MNIRTDYQNIIQTCFVPNIFVLGRRRWTQIPTIQVVKTVKLNGEKIA